MKLLRFGLLTPLLAIFVSSAFALDPVPGFYNSPSLGGSVLEGRSSNSWVQAGNAAAGNGDVWNSMSWDGSALGSQWKFQCATSSAPHTITDNRDANGTGTVEIATLYSGGTFFLSKNGPWGDSVNDHTGTLGVTSVTTILQYVFNNFITGRENIFSSGLFDGSACALTFLLTNGIRLTDTDSETLPGDYPGFLDPNCSTTRSFGNWGDIVDISLLIDCPVAVEEQAWSAVKSLYR